MTQAFAIAAMAESCASAGLLLGFHLLVVSEGLRRFGTAELRDAYLDRLSSGGMLGSAAYPDPVHGDAAAEAHLEGSTYVLNGSKAFVPGAAGAGIFLVYAFSGDGGGRTPRSRVVLAVPRDLDGVTIGESEELVGVRASGTARVHFDSVAVPLINRLGDADEGRAVLRSLMPFADLAVASQATGIAAASVAKAVARANEREPNGSLVGSRQHIHFMVAEMLLSLDAARLLLKRAAEAVGGGDRDFSYAAAQARVQAGRAAVQIADATIQILGGAGSLADFGIERHWRDAKTTELNPSTREIALLLTARYLIEES